MPHRLPQIAARGAREQVVMIAHEAVGVDFERESLAALSEPFEEGPTVPLGGENRAPGSAPIHDVISGALVVDAEWSSHPSRLTAECDKSQNLTPLK